MTEVMYSFIRVVQRGIKMIKPVFVRIVNMFVIYSIHISTLLPLLCQMKQAAW